MSHAKVVPVAINSETAAEAPILTSPLVIFSSVGKIDVFNHDIRSNPSPIPRLSVIGR